MFNPQRLAVLALATVILAHVSSVFGQEYPTRTIRMLAGDAGSTTDSFGRLMALSLAGPLGQPIVVENRPTSIMPGVLAKSTPDGYTLSVAGDASWIAPLLQKMDYDPLKDFAPVSTISSYPYYLIAHPSVPISSIKELLDLAKAKPGTLNFGATASPGGESYLATEMLKSMAAINIVRVPFKSNAQALVALVAGQVDLMFEDVGAGMPMVKAGKVRPIAVTTPKPIELAPGVPTMVSSGLPGFEVQTIVGMIAPGGTPGAIVNRVNQEVVRVLNAEDIRARYLNNGIEIAPSTPEQFGQTIKSEMVKWGKVIKDANIKVN